MRMRWLLAALLVLSSLVVAEPAFANHGRDLDCLVDFQFQEDAQAHFNAHPGDPDGLDGDGNGLACEDLPSRGQTPTPPTTTARPTRAGLVQPPNVCHPSYAGACVPIADDVDCPGGTGDGPAFAPAEDFQVVGDDVYGLDRNGNLIACESDGRDDRKRRLAVGAQVDRGAKWRSLGPDRPAVEPFSSPWYYSYSAWRS